MVSEEDRPLSTAEFAEFMGVGVETIRKWIREGSVPGAYIVGGRQYIDLADARSFKNLQRERLDMKTHAKP